MTVFEAWAAVMGSVQGLRKSERNAAQGFNFRGIDQVMSAVGPALREHGVIVMPTAKTVESERYLTAKGGQMHGVTVLVEYQVFGPGGDSFTGAAFGAAADSGDKAVSKAMSVAYRTFLLQGLTVPTDEPDPDAQTHERAASPADQARDQLRRICMEKGVSLNDAAERFKVAHGAALRDSDDVAAINGLISHYGGKT